MSDYSALTPISRTPLVSAIVCAYNEEKTIAGVLNALLASPRFDQIIVVDDGSADRTPEILGWYALLPRVRAIYLEENCGKGRAMAEAVQAASGDLLLFVDADLLNWQRAYEDALIEPLVKGEAGMVVGYPVRERDIYQRMDPLGLINWLSGERALWRHDLLPVLDAMREARFGVETIINLHYRRLQLPVQIVPLIGLLHPTNLEKAPLRRALGHYQRELDEITRAALRHPDLLLAAAGVDQRAFHRANQRMRRRLAGWLLEGLEA